MASVFFDLSIASGGAGTNTNPYGLAQFLAGSTIQGNTGYVKGIGSGNMLSVYPTAQIKRWDTSVDQYGVGAPWAVAVNGVTIGTPASSSIEGGIIISSAFTFAAGPGSSTCSFRNCVIKWTSMTWSCLRNNSTTLNFVGCWVDFFGTTCTNAGGPPVNNANFYFNATDSVLIQRSGFGYQTYVIANGSFNNICTNTANISNIISNGTGNSKNQTSLSPTPTLPAYNDTDKTHWTKTAVGITIGSQSPNGASQKPDPGAGSPAYNGYTTGLWAEPRLGIGAFYFTPPTPPPTTSKAAIIYRELKKHFNNLKLKRKGM